MADRRRARRNAHAAALLAALAVLLPLAPAPLDAQAARIERGAPPDSLGLEPGRRVRVQLGTYRGRVAGTIDSMLATGFVLDTASRDGGLPFMAPAPTPIGAYRVLRVDYDEIAQIEVSRGTSRARGLLLWGSVGGAAGALLGGLNDDQSGYGPDDAPGFASRALPGAIVGAVLGGALGWFTGRERWAPAGWP